VNSALVIAVKFGHVEHNVCSVGFASQ